ncbi:MAG: sigma-70 family RNA polymerase sigma factor [Armatimonadetes bacterium]|nr:sigma-70 family RNA polymerase sigma factor [Armatimonadota bacterium]
MTDEDLGRQARTGDHDAFIELTHRHQHKVYRMAYRFAGTAEDADDLSQECFIRAYRKIAKYDHRRPFGPWLMKVCANQCINWSEGRARTVRRECSLTEESWPSEIEGAELTTEKNMDRTLILEAIQGLPPATRLLIVMRFTNGQTLREISEQTGIQLPTVAFRIAKAIQSLRETLVPEGKQL